MFGMIKGKSVTYCKQKKKKLNHVFDTIIKSLIHEFLLFNETIMSTHLYRLGWLTYTISLFNPFPNVKF